MRLQGSAARLTIIVDEVDAWHHTPLYVEIIQRARREGIAGATALRGVQGYAALSPIHTAHLFTLVDHLPVVIILVDDHTRIEAFLNSLDEVLHKGVVLLDDVEAIRYLHDPAERRHRFRRHE
jgi:uncharacterized protein